jgi:hypothetical protein
VVKLTWIDRRFCEQLASLAKRLSDTPGPGGKGCRLDDTLLVWSNGPRGRPGGPTRPAC